MDLKEKIKDVLRPYKWGAKLLNYMLKNDEIIYQFECPIAKNFYDYYINTIDFPEKMKMLLDGFSQDEQKNLKFLFARTIFSSINNNKISSTNLLTEDEKKEKKSIKENFLPQIHRKADYYEWENYKLPLNFFLPEVFYSNMGINFINDKQKLIGKDFIDAGAFIGDSALVLEKLSPNKIYAFEPVANNYNLLGKTIKLNNSNDIIPVNFGLGSQNKDEIIYINKKDMKGCSTSESLIPSKELIEEKIKITTIDTFVEENNLTPGLIKMDVEGLEFDVIQGALKTIKKFKPAMMISIYHTGKDFFEIKPILEKLNLGYKFKVHKVNFTHVICDTILFCEAE